MKLNINRKLLVLVLAVSLIAIAATSIFFFNFASWGLQDYKIQESRIFSFLDTDTDDIIDWFDNCPDTINPNQENFDGDKLGDICDIDQDNDGIVNGLDAFAQNPEEWDDFDFDGIGANEDEDDDNDGILDINDPSPSPIATQLTMRYIDLIENCAIMDPGPSRQHCFGDFFGSLIDEGESNSDVINFSFFLAKRGVTDDCHFTAHHIGYAAFEKNPNLAETITSTVYTCRYGFYHGVLSAFFDNLKKEGKDVSNWHKVACDELIDTIDYIPCVHGIGHGLVFVHGDDLKTSSDACKELSGLSEETCIDGVMMQYTDNKLTSSTSWEKDISTICSKTELTSLETNKCYLQLGRSLVFLTNHDKEKSTEFCNMLEEDRVGKIIGTQAIDMNGTIYEEDFEQDVTTILLCLMGIRNEITESAADQKTEIPFN